jgi:hippurate hydrolase
MKIITDRRALHRIPELGRDLPKTLEYLKNSLKDLDCRVFSPMEGALCAFFDFGADSAIAFRADADALPVTERRASDYASTHPGQMHACGHDGHMAIVLELARRLNGKANMTKNVLLVFQPAEETTGGAKDLCDTGIFGNYAVEAIFGLHLWPGLEAGVIASRENELMSRSSEVNVDIYGKAAHIGKSWEGVDAMAAAVDFYRRVTAMEKQLPDHIFRLLKFGKMESGVVRNVISAHTRLEGSLRAFQDSVFDSLKAGIEAAARAVEGEFGCTVTLHFSQGYPAVLNPSGLFHRVKERVDFRELEVPSMTSEDFSWYQRYLPGLFFFLGTGDSPALHADDFDFDDTILTKGADFFEKLAETFQ